LPSRFAGAERFTAMLIPQLPFASLTDIGNNFVHVGETTGFTVQQFIAQIIAVTVLFLVINKFAWKPVRGILEQRRETIEESLANADKIKSQLADAEATRLSIIQKANEKANTIIAEAEKSALAVGEQRTKEATRQAEDIIKNAHEAAVLDRNRLMAELKQHLGELVIQTTQKVTGKVLTPADQTRLNSETMSQLEARQN
jgi:F-type H+-transporting ATPase subunit b